jgi:putative aldouronate transport system substrate-binding protein
VTRHCVLANILLKEDNEMVKSRRWFLVALLLGAVAFVAAASGQKDAAPSVSAQDHSQYYEVTLYQETFNPKIEEYAAQNSFRKLLKDKFNFGYKTVANPGDPIEKLTLMLAAGDYPDLVRLYRTDIAQNYIKAGALLELGPLMDKYAPNMIKRNQQFFPMWKALSGVDDGKIWLYTYSAPDDSYGIARPFLEWVLRSDMLAQQGYPSIKNEQDLLAVLKQGLKDNPKTADGKPTVGIAYPLAAWGTTGALVITYLTNLGKYHHFTYNHGMLYDYDAKKFIDITSIPQYKEGMKFWNTAYREGVLDKESLTDSYDTYAPKMQEGRALANWFMNWDYPNFNATLKQAGKTFSYVPMPLMLKYDTDRGISKVYDAPSVGIWNSMALTKNAKYPARLMEVLDWAATEEGFLRIGWGEPGVQYTVEANGHRVPTADYLKAAANNDPVYPFTWAAEQMFGFANMNDAKGQSYQIGTDADAVALTMDPIVKDVYAKYGWKNYRDSYYNNKNFKFVYGLSQDFKQKDPTYTDDQKKSWEKIDALTNEYTVKLIVAKDDAEFTKLYQEMVDKRNALGMQDLVTTWDNEYRALQAKYGLK